MGLLPAIAVITGCTSTPSSTAASRVKLPASRSTDRPCGTSSRKATYDHVIWVWMENESYSSIIGSPSAFYANALARSCALAGNYSGISHPSLPNYLAATGGQTFGISDDGEPSTHPINSTSIFSQVDAAHLTWRAYDESMPIPCDTVTSGLYATRHNPAVYYVGLRAACAQDDVAMGSLGSGSLARALQNGTLANFSFVTPNTCDDGHDCSVNHADNWLSQFLPLIFHSPQYRSSHVAVFVVWDEGNGNNHVPLIVAGPTVHPGAHPNAAFDHYALLRTTESLLGLAPLGNAKRAASMVPAFGL